MMFTYDQVNHYHYAMDEYGNLLAEQKLSGGTGAPKGMAMPVDVTTNRLAGKPYDSLGNQVTTESGTATLNLAYWDQGHVSRVWGGGTGKTYHYYYDAEGKRRIKLVRADGTQAVLGWTVSCYEGEDLACEQDQGDRVQPETAYASKFLLTDHLGTTRAELRIDAAGQPSVTQPTDTMPYGELIDPPSSSSDPVLFTGKQCDAESGMDFFGARFYSNGAGRWSSPDPLILNPDLFKPQEWNLYLYVGFNPINQTDPDGYSPSPGGGQISYYIDGMEDTLGIATCMPLGAVKSNETVNINVIVSEKKSAYDAMAIMTRLTTFGTAFTMIRDIVKTRSELIDEFVDKILKIAKGRKIGRLTIYAHSSISALVIGAHIFNDTPTYRVFQALVRLNGNFSKDGLIEFFQCGSNFFDIAGIQRRKAQLQLIANIVGVRTTAPVGDVIAGFGSIMSSWIWAKPNANPIRILNAED